jgi:hypothetical protein
VNRNTSLFCRLGFVVGVVLSFTGPAYAGWVKVADQYQNFTLTKASNVRFGTGTTWATKTLGVGSQYCFWTPDPAPGKQKQCQVEVVEPVVPTKYISNCDAGAQPGCVPGNDNASGDTPATAWRTIAAAERAIASIPSGGAVRFARGGAWLNAELFPRPANATAAGPVTLGDYTPAWCSSADCIKAAPLLVETKGIEHWGIDNQTSHIRFENLHLKGVAGSQFGIWTWNGATDIRMSGIEVSGFDIGVYCGTGIKNVQLSGAYIHDNRAMGTLWDCSNSIIQGSTFDSNARGSIYDHNIYVSFGVEHPGTDVKILNNKLTKNSEANGVCYAVSLVVHGVIDGLLIEGNEVIQSPIKHDGGCWGIAVSSGRYGETEVFKNVIIRGNTLKNLGGYYIECDSCINPIIENNTLIQEAFQTPLAPGVSQPQLVGAIALGGQKRVAETVQGTGATIRNNTITLMRGSKDDAAINFFEEDQTPGIDNVVTGNTITFGPAVDTSAVCFKFRGTQLVNEPPVGAIPAKVKAFTTFDNNKCLGSDRWSDRYGTLGQAKAAGYDLNGTFTP